MPKELRYVAFTAEELGAAVGGFLRRRGLVPNDRPVWVRSIQSHPDVAVLVAVGYRDDARERWVRGNELAAAMIDYCIRNGIPLPAQGSKWLRVMSEGVALGIGHRQARDEPDTLLAPCLAGQDAPAAPSAAPAVPAAAARETA